MEPPLLPPGSVDEKLERIAEMLRSISEDEPGTRRRLKALRASPAYRESFETSDPLVSIVIPTYRSFETLRDVALPSALAQTHANIEVVVVGDASPAETAEVVRECGDDRARFENLTIRGPYPDDGDRTWLVAGTPPYNAGVASARGLWIAPLGDDDAFAPDHVERLLTAAVDQGLELVYAPLHARRPDGGEEIIGAFPPQLGQFGLQGALYHAGLSFFELNLADELYGVPNDWSLCRRMMRAGVRIGMVETASVDHFPAWHWGRREAQGSSEPRPAPVDDLAVARDRAAELERQLAAITSSRSWRLTAPMRRLRRRAWARTAR